MPNYVDNLDVIDATNQIQNVLLQDRNSLALATEAIGRISTLEKLKIVTPQMFGAVGDGVADDTQAFKDAIADGRCVFVPKGTYLISDTLTISNVFTTIIGESAGGIDATLGCSKIVFTGSGKCIEVPTQKPTTIKNLLITNHGSGDVVGVDLYNVDYFILDNLHVVGFSNAIKVNGTAWGDISNCHADRCTQNGFYITANTTVPGAQVNITNCIAELCDGVGFLFYNGESSAMSTGSFIGNKTFANTGGGVYYKGTQNHPISNVYISDCFIGGDGVSGLIIETYGDFPVLVNNCYFEQAGMENTGHNFTTPPSQYGHAIQVYNSNVSISNCAICTSAESGITLLAGKSRIVNCDFYNNGVRPNPSATQNCGLFTQAGNTIVDSCTFRSALLNSTGVYNYTTEDIVITSCDFSDVVTGVGNIQAATKIKNNINQADST